MTPRTPIVAQSTNHLRHLVNGGMLLHGYKCDLNHIDVSSITNFKGLFKDTDFNGDVSRWDMSNATDVSEMFQRSLFNGDVSKWNTANIENATALFDNSSFAGDVSKWNTQNLRVAERMFRNTTFNGDLSRWNTSNLTDATSMFEYSTFNGDISQWDVRALRKLRHMFAESRFNGDLSQWDMKEPLRHGFFDGMFLGNSRFKGDLSAWTMDDPQRFEGMFDGEYRGGLPRFLSPINAFAEYAELFKTQDDLQNYLASVPFGHAHAQILCNSAICPPWCPPNDYSWFKETAAVGRSIGMDNNELALHVWTQYPQRRNKAPVTALPLNDFVFQ